MAIGNRQSALGNRRGLVWLIGGRAAVLTVLLGSAILIQLRAPGVLPADPFFFLIGLTYGLTVVWALTLKFVDEHPWLLDVQLACDAVIASAIVYLTGGVASYFSSLYTLPIIAASTVQSWRGGMMVGVLSTVLYAGLVFAQYAGTGGVPIDGLPPIRVALFTVGLNAFGFLAVATLSGYLAEGLRRTGAQLEEASTQLADLQAFSQHVIDSLMSGLATTTMSGTVLTFNRAAETITGLRADDAVGRHVMEVLQLPAGCAPLFDHSGNRPALPRLEYGYTRAASRPIELGISTALLLTPRGESGFLFTFLDVTEAKRLEREARVQQRLAAVGEMAAGIAHEIRNPLASMAGSLQVLRDELALTGEQSQLMDIVLRESERLNGIIRDFLAYARPQRAAMALIDVRQVLTETARLLENNAELAAGHEIAVTVPDDPVWFRADGAQIRQIVWNLATNGLRAMPSGGRLRLGLRQTPAGDGSGDIVIVVEDQGVGIPPDEVDGIFQPFRGAFTRGTGLGLSIVHRIVTDYGGEVRVTSHRGVGTTIEVTLPVAPAPLAPVDPPALQVSAS
jgi:two-component system sensor histidine kinase PilS (NtrC family)